MLVKNISGKTYNNFTVIEQSAPPERLSKTYRANASFWRIRCNLCYKELIHSKTNILKGPSCICRKDSALERLYKIQRYNAEKRRGLLWLLTRDQFKTLLTSECHYCKIPPRQVFKLREDILYYNGIDRKDNLLGYLPDNTLPCCGHCNAMKLILSYDEFLDKISHIYKNLCADRELKPLINHPSPGRKKATS